MLRNSANRNMHQGEEVRLRSGSLARERKHLALCINNKEEVKSYHRCCSHSGGPALQKIERSEEDNKSLYLREQQQHLEIKATIIQRAWRASLSRKVNLEVQEENHTRHEWKETRTLESLHNSAVTSDIFPMKTFSQHDFLPAESILKLRHHCRRALSASLCLTCDSFSLLLQP